jgi:site-specific DNA recombinase
MKAVALYARVSSDKQEKEATIDSQVAALIDRAKADGHTVIASDHYVDDGCSGSTLVRPALEKLRDRAAEGGLDLLYVHSPDRLARKYAYQVLLLEELTRSGISVVFLNGPTNRSAEDELLLQVQGMGASRQPQPSDRPMAAVRPIDVVAVRNQVHDRANTGSNELPRLLKETIR